MPYQSPLYLEEKAREKGKMVCVRGREERRGRRERKEGEAHERERGGERSVEKGGEKQEKKREREGEKMLAQ